MKETTDTATIRTAATDRKGWPHYVVIEGPIGVGKTSLARRLAMTFNYDTLLEQPEHNPFLERFYQNPRQYALQTQLFFLFQRIEQVRSLQQNDLFMPVQVSDFLLDKDRLFAELTLDQDEFTLYDRVYRHLSISTPLPDLVIYLQAPTDVLLRRIEKRNIPHEQQISADYLNRLNEAYARFFHFYDQAPLLIVNASDIDPLHNDADYQQLLDRALDIRSGRHYFNPRPLA